VRRKCADGSLARSALLYAEAVVQRWLGSYEVLDRVIAPSQFMMNAVTGWRFPAERVAIVYNGVDPAITRTAVADDGYFLYLGRLSSEKGLFTLCEAHAQTNLRMVIAGTGPLEGQLRERFPRLELVGHQTGRALEKLIGNAAAVIVPSEWFENCPMSILEAMACGKPVVASRIGGIPELVVDGETWLLFEPGNSDELRIHLLALANNPEKRRALGRAARARVEARFSLDQHNQKVLDILRTVANKH